MWPLLINWGPFQLKTLTVFAVVALVVTAFVYWRKCREEHYSEEETFDGFLLATVVSLLAARVGFVVLNIGQLGFAPWRWLDIVTYPGWSFTIGLFGAAWYLYRFANRKRWDVFEILDYWTTAVTAGLTVLSVGLFFDGTFFGTKTTMPWGLVFPGVFDKHHPLQLYFAVFYAVLFWYLVRTEYRYRTYNWYRAGRNTAQTGFLTSMALIWWGAFQVLISPISVPQLVVAGWNLDPFLAGACCLGGIGLLVHRSGRSLIPGRSQRPRVK